MSKKLISKTHISMCPSIKTPNEMHANELNNEQWPCVFHLLGVYLRSPDSGPRDYPFVALIS